MFARIVMFLVVLSIILILFALAKLSMRSRNNWSLPADHMYSNDIPDDLFTGLDNYRLGDVFKHVKLENKFSNHGLKVWGIENTSFFDGSLREYTLLTFPNSIASKYLQKTNKPGNFDMLLTLCHEVDVEAPPSDSLVIHLRVGDVIDHSHHTLEEFLLNNICEKGNSLCYVTSLPTIMNRAAKFKQICNVQGPCNVILVAGAHVPGPHPKSKRYIAYLRKALQEQNFNCTLRIASHPDEDLAFMAKSRHFSPARGGFSAIIAKLVKMQNNMVFE